MDASNYGDAFSVVMYFHLPKQGTDTVIACSPRNQQKSERKRADLYYLQRKCTSLYFSAAGRVLGFRMGSGTYGFPLKTLYHRSADPAVSCLRRRIAAAVICTPKLIIMERSQVTREVMRPIRDRWVQYGTVCTVASMGDSLIIAVRATLPYSRYRGTAATCIRTHTNWSEKCWHARF